MQTAARHIAVVFFPENHTAFEEIYGLTILERTLHALERGGISGVFLPENVQLDVTKVIKTGSDWKIDIHFLEQDQEIPVVDAAGIVVLGEPLVIDPKVVEGMVEASRQETDALSLKNKKAAFFPSGIYQKLQSFSHSLGSDLHAWLHAVQQLGFSVRELDFPGLICESVHTPAEKKAVKKALIQSLIKPTDGWVSRHLNRPVSTRISRVLAYTPVTPNQFTIVTGLIGLATGVFAAMGGYWNYLIAGFLFHLTSILDGVDGELARLKFKSSPFGQWLDTLVDNLSYVAGLAGIIVGILRTGASDAVKIAALLAVVFVVLALGSLYLYLLRFKSGGTLLNVKYSFQDGDSKFDKFMQVAAGFGKRDLFALIFFILGILGQLPMALGYIAIMAFFVFVFSLQAHFKAAKEQIQ